VNWFTVDGGAYAVKILKAAETIRGVGAKSCNTKTRKTVAVKEAVIVLGSQSEIRNRELAAALGIDPSAVISRIDAARTRGKRVLN